MAAGFLTEALEAYQSAERLQATLVTQFPDAEVYEFWLLEFEQSARRVRELLDRS